MQPSQQNQESQINTQSNQSTNPAFNASPYSQQAVRQSQTDPGQIYGIVGLVLFLFGLSLVGAIISFIGQKKSQAAGIKIGLSTIMFWINTIVTIIVALLITFVFIIIPALLRNQRTQTSTQLPQIMQVHIA